MTQVRFGRTVQDVNTDFPANQRLPKCLHDTHVEVLPPEHGRLGRRGFNDNHWHATGIGLEVLDLALLNLIPKDVDQGALADAGRACNEGEVDARPKLDGRAQLIPHGQEHWVGDPFPPKIVYPVGGRLLQYFVKFGKVELGAHISRASSMSLKSLAEFAYSLGSGAATATAGNGIIFSRFVGASGAPSANFRSLSFSRCCFTRSTSSGPAMKSRSLFAEMSLPAAMPVLDFRNSSVAILISLRERPLKK